MTRTGATPGRVGQLRHGLLEHGDVVGRGVGAGIARAQDAGQRLAALVQIADQRVEPKPALEVARRPSFSEWAVTSVASKSSVIRSGAAPFAQARSRACRRASRSRPNRSGVIAAMTRQAVGDDATSPNSSGCSRSMAKSARQSPRSRC